MKSLLFRFKKRINRPLKYLKKVYDYAIFLKDDEDWDYSYILKTLQFKLERTRKELLKNNLTTSINRQNKQLKYAIYLIEKILKEDYCTKEWAAHETKWGELKIERHVDPLGTISIFKRTNVFSKDDHEQENSESTNLYKKEDALKAKTYNRLFRHLNLYIQNWWD
jgi:hypothetical protein